jgi:hypothetical protein
LKKAKIRDRWKKGMANNVYTKNRLVKYSQSSSIVSLFFEEFEDVFTENESSWDEVKMIFKWLREEARNARYFSDINAIDRCRRISESYFSKVESIKVNVRTESKKVNCELRKRFDELRITRRSRKSKLLSLLAYEHEHDKTPPPR